MKVTLQRKNNAFHFEATNEDDATINFDSTREEGGENKGFRPMQSLLGAMGACSAIDIILILKKQKQTIDDFRIEIDGERETGTEPSLWKIAHVRFFLKGKIDQAKAERAAELSMKKYCSVAATLGKAGASITYEMHVNE